MSLIAISAWSHCLGEEIAKRVARKLEYEAVGPEIMNEVAKLRETPLPKLMAALGRQETLLGVTPRERRRLLAYLEAATLARLAQDRAVTWGLGAHLYVMGVSHLLKVRLVRDWETRVQAMAQKSGASQAATAKALKKEDETRARVAREVYRQQEDDPTLYDLTINLMQIGRDQAVEIIAEAAQHKRFKPMTFSRKLMADQVLAARVRAELAARHPEVQVAADGGQVLVTVPAAKRDQDKKVAAVRELAQAVAGVGELKVEVVNDYLEEAAESMR